MQRQYGAQAKDPEEFWALPEQEIRIWLRTYMPEVCHEKSATAPLKDRLALYYGGGTLPTAEKNRNAYASTTPTPLRYVIVRKGNGVSRIVEEEFVSLFAPRGEDILLSEGFRVD